MGSQSTWSTSQKTWRDDSQPVATRIAFVSGGMGGIGTAICRRLGAAGHTVVAGCLPGYEKKAEWLGAMRSEGFRVHAAEGDVADFDSCAEMFYNVRSVRRPGRHPGQQRRHHARLGVQAMTEQDWMAVINTNLNSVFNVTRQVIDGMGERGWGRIINISSVNAIKGQFGQTNYSAAKAGMAGFSKALAQEVVRKGVTVNTVSPGYVETDMVMAIRKEVRDQIVAQIPMGRLAQARGNRRGGRVPRLRGSGLHHRRQHLGQRRHAHDVDSLPADNRRRRSWQQQRIAVVTGGMGGLGETI